MPYVVTPKGKDGRSEAETGSLKEAVRIGEEAEAEGRTGVEITNLQGQVWGLRYAKVQLGSLVF